MAEITLQRLLQIGKSLPNATFREEQRDLVLKLAGELNIPLDDTVSPREAATSPREAAISPREAAKSPRDEISSQGVSSAREKFKQQEKQHAKDNAEQKRQVTNTKKEARKTAKSSPPISPGIGNSDCDISSKEIQSSYEKVRDDSESLNWLSMGYGSSKKVLELYGSGEGGLKEFTSSLKDDEVTYGYVRVIYGDSQRSKFVFISYVPDGLSILTKSKANTHKPAITSYLKYMHCDVYANSLAELEEDVIQAKLKAAAGANYGTGGTAAAGSEDFGSIKDNAKNFFQQTEGKGSKSSIVYNKDPLGGPTPVSLTGRPGITEKYIKT